MNIFTILIGILGGMCLAIQSGINAQLKASWAQDAILAAAISFTVSSVALIILIAILRITIPPFRGSTTKWWYWIAGCLGAYSVFAGAFLAPIIGAGLLVGLYLMGQLSAAVMLDHFGLVGFAVKRMTINKMMGLGFLAIGALLIHFY